ncbi:MAG: ribulokinase [Bacteroidales bacterium]|nr:ribulokinase [Bacteroidales bacterium]
MDRDKYVLGADFGSDSVRVLAFDTEAGTVAAKATCRYPRWAAGRFCAPEENRYRQHPLDYIESLEACIKEIAECIDPYHIAGISFDTTASTPVLTDRYGTPLSLTERFMNEPDAMFFLWKDHTSIKEAERINEVAHSWKTDYTRWCGGSYSCEWVWAKMLHALHSSPCLAEAAYSWVEHCDWIPGLLSGNTDPHTIARSKCAAGHKAMWNRLWGGLPERGFLHEVDPLLDIFDGHLYKETVTADRRAGTLCKEWAERLGLKEGISIGSGAIDCHFGAVGAGIAPGTLVKVIGTSTCDIAIASCDDIGDKTIKGICGQADGSVLPGYIGIEAGQAAFGDVYAWYSRLLSWGISNGSADVARETILSRLAEEAARLPLTDKDTVALDWFNGRRSPDADTTARAAICGIDMSTSPAHIYKALVEATAYGSRAINERLAAEGVKIEKTIAVGGISKKSPYVMQTISDILGTPISVLDSDEACALGACMYASVAAGIYQDITEAQKRICPGTGVEYLPDPERHAIYDRLYMKYMEIGRQQDIMQSI